MRAQHPTETGIGLTSDTFDALRRDTIIPNAWRGAEKDPGGEMSSFAESADNFIASIQGLDFVHTGFQQATTCGTCKTSTGDLIQRSVGSTDRLLCTEMMTSWDRRILQEQLMLCECDTRRRRDPIKDRGDSRVQIGEVEDAPERPSRDTGAKVIGRQRVADNHRIAPRKSERQQRAQIVEGHPVNEELLEVGTRVPIGAGLWLGPAGSDRKGAVEKIGSQAKVQASGSVHKRINGVELVARWTRADEDKLVDGGQQSSAGAQALNVSRNRDVDLENAQRRSVQTSDKLSHVVHATKRDVEDAECGQRRGTGKRTRPIIKEETVEEEGIDPGRGNKDGDDLRPGDTGVGARAYRPRQRIEGTEWSAKRRGRKKMEVLHRVGAQERIIVKAEIDLHRLEEKRFGTLHEQEGVVEELGGIGGEGERLASVHSRREDGSRVINPKTQIVVGIEGRNGPPTRSGERQCERCGRKGVGQFEPLVDERKAGTRRDNESGPEGGDAPNTKTNPARGKKQPPTKLDKRLERQAIVHGSLQDQARHFFHKIGKIWIVLRLNRIESSVPDKLARP
ncbi:hypothetical protein DFH06DRAFT_1124219 [Mycena polygramma]|nr:hypothetical protein DFH06DRAFT_1124219 [Mycena polygramma]